MVPGEQCSQEIFLGKYKLQHKPQRIPTDKIPKNHKNKQRIKNQWVNSRKNRKQNQTWKDFRYWYSCKAIFLTGVTTVQK